MIDKISKSTSINLYQGFLFAPNAISWLFFNISLCSKSTSPLRTQYSQTLSYEYMSQQRSSSLFQVSLIDIDVQFALIFFKFIYLFIYFWLCWVFFAAHGVWASHCGGFSCRARALGTWASVVVAHRLSSCGSQALERRLSSRGTKAQLLHGMWDLPRPGLEPMSSALADGFLTTAPPGKPCFHFYHYKSAISLPHLLDHTSWLDTKFQKVPIKIKIAKSGISNKAQLWNSVKIYK